MWRLSNTWQKPTSQASMQRGFPAPGAGDQYSGAGPGHGAGRHTPREPLHPTKGSRTFFQPLGRGQQQGFPPPEEGAQRRPPGSMPNRPPVYGRAIEVWTPYFSRGAGAYVENFGRPLVNPIGAGIVVGHRPRPSYGPSGQYVNGAIFWTSQVIPTSIPLIGLTSPETLEAIVGGLNVQAMVRTTG
jgi:hypothetical protein